ncbi:MAG: PEGA domain-containing protein [Lacunisphaera sp.]|jgi:hypothetical protein|nr:PEGA domain-containing protein [Lacunisphaera sp.]
MDTLNCPRFLLAVVLVLGVAGCSKSPEEIKAAQAKVEAETTGRLLVKSNRANTTAEATRLPAAGEAAADSAAVKGNEEGAAEQTLTRLPPGKYTVTAHSDGWPDLRTEATVTAGQAAEVTLHFKSGSLKLDTVPTGATVKQGKSVLGKTPLVIPQLPVGDCSLSLEYQSWPPLTHTVSIAENTEAAATVRLPHGRLTVASVPAGATVVLDRKAYNKTPLFFDPISPGPKQLTLQLKDFPPLEVSVTVVDGEEVKINPVLGTAFPVLDPAELLRAVWIADDSTRAAGTPNATTGIYRPKNDVVKNLHRERLYNRWQRKIYRFAGPLKSYDAATGRVEFAEQKSELARYRLVAQVEPGTPSPQPDQKDAKDKAPVVLAVYGRLTAVEEPTWPGRVITLEFSDADFLPEAMP